MIFHNFAYLLKNPNLHPPAREAFTREAAHTQDSEVAEEICKRDLWKNEVVEKAKFHYNYRYPEPIVEVQPEPPPEKDFWDAWIAEDQPVPEFTPSPLCETQKKRKGARPATSRSTSRISTNGFISYSRFPSRHLQGLGWVSARRGWAMEVWE